MSTIIKEDGEGIAGANSYLELADAKEYHEISLDSETWDAADDPKLTKAILMAARILETQFNWIGRKAKEDQAMAWPRIIDGKSVLPFDIAAAQAEIAKDLLETSSFQVRPAGSNGADQVEEISLGKGALKIGFQSANQSTPESNDEKTVVSPYVIKMVFEWGKFKHSSGGMRKAFRG